MTTLDDGNSTVTLTDNCYWADEFQWVPIAQTRERTLSGAEVVEESEKKSGRPITLRGAWVTRAKVQALEALQANVATTMTLTLPDGRTRTVYWRRDSPGVEAKPLYPKATPNADTLYKLTLRLMEA